MPLRILFQSNAPWVASGYGTTTRNLAEMWRTMGHEVGIFASYGIEGGSFVYDGFKVFSRGYQQWGSDVVEAHAVAFNADVVITNIDTFVLQNYGTRKIKWIPIVPIMEDPLTTGIRNSLNGAYSLVSISEYGQHVLSDAGLSSTMLRLPVDTGKFIPVNKREARKTIGLPEDGFIIGNVGMNRGNRKGHELLLRAFARVVIDIPNAILYLHTHTRQPDGLDLNALINTLGLNSSQVVTPSDYNAFYGMPTEWMVALYSAMSVYVQPSRNEGQAMPLFEAMSCGVPVIATDATALSEVLDVTEGRRLPVVNRPWLQSGAWSYETTEGEIYQAIMSAYEEYGRDHVSMENRQAAIEKVSVVEIGLRWQQFLLETEKRLRFQPTNPKIIPLSPDLKIVQLTSCEKHCGVGGYSRALTASLEGSTDVSMVEIRTFDPTSLPHNTTILHVQHEPSLIRDEKVFEEQLRTVRQRGVKIVETFHNINDTVNNHLNNGAIDCALFHWPPNGVSVNDKRIKILGGMGVPSFTPPRLEMYGEIRARYGFSPQDTIISTFGFACVGRGHYEVPEELVGAMKNNPHLKFQLLLPPNFLNQDTAPYVHNRLDQVMENYGIQGQIIHEQKFLPDTEVLMRLWMSDVGYLYLPGDTHSSSSALRFFIASRLPVLVSPSSHFADVQLGTVTANTFSLIDFSQQLLHLSGDKQRLFMLRQNHEITYEKWRWPVFAERMLVIYRNLLDL